MSTVQQFMVIAAVAALLAGCNRQHAAPGSAQVEPGRWRGDVTADEFGVVVGIMLDVSAGTEPWEVIAFPLSGLRGGTLDVRAGSGGFEFNWPGSDVRECRVQLEGEELVGECTHPRQQPWQLRLQRPGNTASVGIARRALADSRFAWTSRDSGRVRVHAPSELALTEDELRNIALHAERALARADEVLGGVPMGYMLDVLVVTDRAGVGAVSGQAVAAMADPLAGTVVVQHTGATGTPLTHEVMHVASVLAWANPAEPAAWIVEGLATLHAGTCLGYSMREVTAALRRDGLTLPMNDVIHRFAQQDDLVAYLQSASFLEFLSAQHGLRILEMIWRDGLPATLDSHDTDLQQAETAWMNWLAAIEAPAVDWTDIRARGCG